MNYERISNYKDTKFKRTVGVPRILFEILVEIIRNYLLKLHRKGGRKPKLNAENLLLMFFYYYRDYPTFLSLANQFSLDESNAWRWIRKIEKILYDCFSIEHSNIEFSQLINISYFDANEKTIRIVDVTECNIQRSKKVDIQKEYYSGKKKKHTLKIQIIIEEVTNKILSIAFEKGSVHDYKVFKNTTEDINKEISFLADSGYQGIDKIFKHSTTPKKKSKNNPLTDEDKEFNHLISTNRISVEHTNCQVKIFRILSERYRNRIKTFFIPAILICNFYNLCL